MFKLSNHPQKWYWLVPWKRKSRLKWGIYNGSGWWHVLENLKAVFKTYFLTSTYIYFFCKYLHFIWAVQCSNHCFMIFWCWLSWQLSLNKKLDIICTNKRVSKGFILKVLTRILFTCWLNCVCMDWFHLGRAH